MPTLRTIKQIVSAIEKAEGAGVKVRRSIGIRSARNFTPFVLFDHFSSSGSNGFPEHPHSGQETISLLLNGSMAHEDFTGSKGILYAGDLQFMTAGKGIVHSEMPIPSKDGTPTEGVQLWVDLPKELKRIEPRYRDLRAWEIPEVIEQNGKLKIKVISGKSYGVESVKELAYNPVHYYHYKMKPGASFKQELEAGFNYFLYVLNGDGLVLNGATKVSQYDNVFLNKEGDLIRGEIAATEVSEKVEFVIVGGKLLDQNIVQNGPFVATSKDEMKEILSNYQYAKNGFENLRNWKTLISRGVNEEMINGPLNGNLENREKERLAFLASKDL